MLNINYKKSILTGLSLVIIAMIGVIPSVMASISIVFPYAYTKGGELKTKSLGKFEDIDGKVIKWSGSDWGTTICFSKPSTRPRKDNYLEMVIRFAGDLVLGLRINSYSNSQLWFFIGDEGEFVYARVLIPNYDWVYSAYFYTKGPGSLEIDYLCACYVNLGPINPINFTGPMYNSPGLPYPPNT